MRQPTNQDRARRLLRAARMLLAWDAMKTEVKEFTTLKNIVQMGGQVFKLLDTLVKHYYPDNLRNLKAAHQALARAYIGTEQLRNGLPPETVARIQSEAKHYYQQLFQAAGTDAHQHYKSVGFLAMSNAFTLLPLSSMVAVLVKSGQPYWQAGQAFLKSDHTPNRPAKPTIKKPAGEPVGASVRVAAHDEATLKLLFTKVFPWVAQQASGDDGKAEFPSQDLQKRGTDFGLHFAKEFRSNFIDADLVRSYRTDEAKSLQALLTFCAFGTAIEAMEQMELKVESRLKSAVQGVLSKIRETEQAAKQQAATPVEPEAGQPTEEETT